MLRESAHDITEQRRRGAYSHLLSGKLQSFVEKELSKPPDDQNEIQEELALVRSLAAKMVGAYNKAMEANNSAAVIEIGGMMQKQLGVVTRMAGEAAKIQAMSRDTLSLGSVEQIVNSIIDLIFEVLKDEPNGVSLAARIEKRIAVQVNLSTDRGTVTLPSDEIVAGMDMSVPQGLPSP